MKREEENSEDRLLRGVLREWQIEEPLPPRFQEHVWRRIARAEEQAPIAVWTHLAERIVLAFARPSLALSYVTVLLAAGLIAGYIHGREDNNRTQHELSVRYAQMMSPYALRH